MSPRNTRSLFLFRRDLRIHDNTALSRALVESAEVMTCFIFDPRQIEDNPWFSRPAFDFMIASIRSLHDEIEAMGGKLFLFEGKHEEIIPRICAACSVQSVYFNRDYTPFSRSRDDAVQAALRESGVQIHIHGDCLLSEPEEIRKADGGPYTVFTPFWKNASRKAVKAPLPGAKGRYAGECQVRALEELPAPTKGHVPGNPFRHGGRTEGLRILSSLDSLKGCEESRDFPARHGTTGLSAHLKFGTVSVREAYHALRRVLGSESPFLRQLYWRDFFTHICYHFPHVLKGAFHGKFDSVHWTRDEGALAKWQEGMTGFPIVDAGMRELNSTGFMHNRVRLITASFLVKDLHLNWRLGEQYFASRLIDYDPAVNNGNWQWVASTGCDAQPYFRIFNPWLQQNKFDPECSYIKKWVPELSSLPHPAIHRLAEKPVEVAGYPPPVVDHAEAGAEARVMFEEL